MLGTAESDLWKYVVFFEGKLYIDTRAQMGVLASAHYGQRLSFLVAAIGTTEASCMFTDAVCQGKLTSTFAKWHQERCQHGDKLGAMPFLLQSFQDDLLQVAVGEVAESIIENVEETVIQDRLSIILSPKEDANEPFASEFDFIGASFDTSDVQNIRRRPSSHILTNLHKDMLCIRCRAGMLSPRKRVLDAVGRAAFCANFIMR